jgi:hypothetical protein
MTNRRTRYQKHRKEKEKDEEAVAHLEGLVQRLLHVV